MEKVYEFPVDAVTNYCNFGGDLKITHTQSLPTLGANCIGLLSGVSRPALPPEAGVRIGPSSWPWGGRPSPWWLHLSILHSHHLQFPLFQLSLFLLCVEKPSFGLPFIITRIL